MFKKLREFFKGQGELVVDHDGGPTDRDLHLATAVLLLEMAGRDAIHVTEVHAIIELMRERCGVSEPEALDLLETAEGARAESGRIDEFVSAINANFNTEDRRHLLSMLWTVVEADGKIDPLERKFMTQMRFRLQLSEHDLEQAIQEASASRKASLQTKTSAA